MILWIDADACPRPIKQVVYRASQRLGIPVRLVTNLNMRPPGLPLVSLVRVEAGFDVADSHIVENAAPEDIVITADVPLAAEVVKKGSVAINPRGGLYDAESIGERLQVRNMLMEMRDKGETIRGPAPFRPADTQKFAAALDRILMRRRNALA